MRVRHLQSHLADQQLVHRAPIERLKNSRVGIDAVFWLRSIQALKDPFADALGGIPPGIFGFVDKELEAFRKFGITPLFVFQGVAPGPQHSMFVSRMDTQMEMAWTYLANGQRGEAQRAFAVSTSRINGDFVYFIFHHLKYKGYECLQAPYFAGAQLAHFAEQGVVQTVFGPPGLLLFGAQSVVIHIDFPKKSFDWVDLDSVLRKWQITRGQFVDACMLAGTEYCLTYPYLNLGGQLPPQSQGRFNFNFDAAVNIVKQAPLINWMQAFPTEDMKNDHVEGYCTCKTLVQNSPVLHLTDHVIRPLGAGTPTPQVPYDFNLIMGDKLPNALYYLMLNGMISHKLPQALAKGEWTDKSQPLVDTKEFRELLVDLKEYREVSLGLIAQHLSPSFQRKLVLCKSFWDPHTIRHGTPGNELPENARTIQPQVGACLKWDIRQQTVAAEMRRQGVRKVDFRFCLTWHAHEFNNDGPLIPHQNNPDDPNSTPWCANDPSALAALVHFMVLERLGLISDEDGGMTVLGNVLKDTPSNMQEPCLVALEMMKFGMLSGEPFDAAQPDRPFPDQVKYPTHPVAPRTKALLLLSRVMSLVPMKLRNDMWNADVDFDLAAFHSLVRILKRTLRQLVEASLASILLKDLSRVKLLTPGFMCASPKKEDHLQTPAMLPTFMLPRACMGIVVRYFLEYTGSPREFATELANKFPCCIQPMEDLKMAFIFWDDLRRCVDEIAGPLEAEELAQDMAEATGILKRQQQAMGLDALLQASRGVAA